jgi:hypothetical protein
MTAPRRQRKLSLPSPWLSSPSLPSLPFLGRGIVLAAAIAAGGWVSNSALQAATTQQIVVDHRTGLAINGFDPVAYFVDGTAQPGKEHYEQVYAGAVWRFRNEGNQAAFIADPDVYVPRFGGYDPVAVARGVAVPGDPRLWLIFDERLYLFYTLEARDTFKADIEALVAAADRRWPAVQLTLSP